MKSIAPEGQLYKQLTQINLLSRKRMYAEQNIQHSNNNHETTVVSTLDKVHNQLAQMQSKLYTLQSSISRVDDTTNFSTEHFVKIDNEVITETAVLGEFDGINMVSYDKRKFPVQKNYASKSKLVPGDKLKLRILSNGQFVYKLIAPVARKKTIATLSKDGETGCPIAVCKEGTYMLNQAAVSYFQANIGDQILIACNKSKKSKYAAIESVIEKIQ